MSITAFSVLSAILWCNFFIIIFAGLRKCKGFIIHFNIFSLLLFAAACICRSLCIFEFPRTIVIGSSYILPAIIDFITFPIVPNFWNGFSLSPLLLLIACWMIGIIFYLIRIINQLVLLRNGIGIKQKIAVPHIQAIMDEIVARDQKYANVKVVQSQEVSIPMIVGFLHPVIYLPDISLSDTELRNILAHEWAHYLHKDAWIKLLMCFIEAFFWWNPFIHILKSCLNHILEIRCDLTVTSHMSEEDKLQYLETILKIFQYHFAVKNMAEYPAVCSISVLVSAKHMIEIEQRFLMVFNQKHKKQYNLTRKFSYVLILALFLASNIFILQPQGQPTVDRGFEETLSITPQNAYLKINSDGSYSVYADEQYRRTVFATEIGKEPFSLLDIKQ